MKRPSIKINIPKNVRRRICKYISAGITAGFGLWILSTLGRADLGEIGILSEAVRLAFGVVGLIGFGGLTAVISAKIDEIERPKLQRYISNNVAVITMPNRKDRIRKIVI